MVRAAIHKNAIRTIGFLVQTTENGPSNSLNLVYFEMKMDGPWIHIRSNFWFRKGIKNGRSIDSNKYPEY